MKPAFVEAFCLFVTGERQAYSVGPTVTLRYSLSQERVMGLGFGKERGMALFSKNEGQLCQESVPGAYRNTRRIVVFQTSETCTTGPTPAMPGTGTGDSVRLQAVR